MKTTEKTIIIHWNKTKKDYMDSYAKLGFLEYMKMNHFMKKYPDFRIQSTEAILTLGNKLSDLEFKEGKLKVYDLEKSNNIADMILSLKGIYPYFNKYSFVKAMVNIAQKPSYDHKKFLSKAKSSKLLKDCHTIDECELMIEMVYNFKTKKKVSLR